MRKHTWKFAILMLAVLLTAGVVLAQDSPQPTAPPPPQKPAWQGHGQGNGPWHGQGRGDGMGLTVQQHEQLRAIRQETADKAAIIRNDSKLSDAQKEEQIKALHESARAQAKGVLTPEQQAKFEQFRQMRRQRMQARLGLTDDQVAKLKNIRTTARNDRQATLQDTKLTQDQKLAKLKAIRESTQTQLKATLTPEQFRMLREMRRRGGMHGGGMYGDGMHLGGMHGGGMQPMAGRQMRCMCPAQTL